MTNIIALRKVPALSAGISDLLSGSLRTVASVPVRFLGMENTEIYGDRLANEFWPRKKLGEPKK